MCETIDINSQILDVGLCQTALQQLIHFGTGFKFMSTVNLADTVRLVFADVQVEDAAQLTAKVCSVTHIGTRRRSTRTARTRTLNTGETK